MLVEQCKRPLLQPKRGAFLDSDLGALRMPAIRREGRDVGIEAKPIVLPVAGRDHPAVKIEDTAELLPIESCGWVPVPVTRERRYDTQALFTFGRG